MRISRIYLPLKKEQVNDSLTIQGEKAHYIRNVLRLKVHHQLHFFTPAGIEYQGIVKSVNKHDVVLTDITALSNQIPTSSLNTTLVQGISSSDRMDYCIQKAAELGCQLLIPVLTDFCSHKVPDHKQTKKHDHWQAVAISACEQSGRADVMQVSPIKTLKTVISEVKQAIYLEPTAATYISQLPPDLQQQHTIFIGPEGGFSPTEIKVFIDRGYLGIQLGQRVLRTETVAPVILAALHALYGDFKPQVV